MTFIRKVLTDLERAAYYRYNRDGDRDDEARAAASKFNRACYGQNINHEREKKREQRRRRGQSAVDTQIRADQKLKEKRLNTPIPTTNPDRGEHFAVESGTGSYVYLIQGDAGGPLKIGCSNNPLWRKASMQSGNPHHLSIIDYLYVEFEDGDPHYPDTIVHEKLPKEDQVYGEWYYPTDAVCEALEAEGFYTKKVDRSRHARTGSDG